MNLDNLTDDVIIWALKRNIIQDSNLPAQFVKLAEEFGELAQGIAKNNPEQIKDSIGDMLVVLIILAEVYGKTYELEDNVEHPHDTDWGCSWVESSLAQAYDEIKDRKGKLIGGVFVKEADL